MIRPEVIETELYYKQGRKKRIVFLCIDKSANDCYYNYYNNLGLKLTIAGHFDKAYNDILSIFISSPFLVGNNLNNNKISGGNSMKLTDVLKIAYSLSQPVRSWLSSVDRGEKGFKSLVSASWDAHTGDIFSLDNPRLWPIVYQMMYAEPLIEVVSDKDPLVFR